MKFKLFLAFVGLPFFSLGVSAVVNGQEAPPTTDECTTGVYFEGQCSPVGSPVNPDDGQPVEEEPAPTTTVEPEAIIIEPDWFVETPMYEVAGEDMSHLAPLASEETIQRHTARVEAQNAELAAILAEQNALREIGEYVQWVELLAIVTPDSNPVGAPQAV